MALDPTGGGGWGLGALGAPSQSIIPLAPKPTMTFTPEQIAQMRAQAMQLQEPPKQNIQSWTQGLAELVRAMQGNREADFARQQEAANRQSTSDAYLGLLPPQSQGGNPSPAAGAAPAGTLGSGPAGAIPSSGDQPAVAPTSTTTADASDPRGMVPYIRQIAAKYGVDPDTAIKVAGSEGLKTFLGDGGKSGGAFQLYTGGGMGNDFQKDTGLDPLDPKNEKATIDYALSKVPHTGWTPFHGAAKAGVGPRDGILTQQAATAGHYWTSGTNPVGS